MKGVGDPFTSTGFVIVVLENDCFQVNTNPNRNERAEIKFSTGFFLKLNHSELISFS